MTTPQAPDLDRMREAAWPLRGYAPGDYMCCCAACGTMFDGDKRAVRCLSCAVVASKATLREAVDRIAELEASIQYDHLIRLKAERDAAETRASTLQGEVDGLRGALTDERIEALAAKIVGYQGHYGWAYTQKGAISVVRFTLKALRAALSQDQGGR